MHHRMIMSVLWMAVAVLVSAAPEMRTAAVTSSPTGPDTAEFWVRRADVELARAAETEPSADLWRKYGLAVATYDAAPSDARRATAAKMIRDELARQVQSCQSKEERKHEYHFAAAAMAEIDDADGTRQLLVDADGPTTLPSSGGISSGEKSPYAHAFALVYLGTVEQFDVRRLPTYAELDHVYYEKFTDGGKKKMADQFRQLVERGDDHRVEGKVFYLVLAGRFADADDAISSESDPGRRLSERVGLLGATYRAGNREWFRRAALKVLAEVALKNDSPIGHQTDEYTMRYIGYAADLGDRQSVDLLVTGLKDRSSVDPAELAIDFAAVGEMDAYRTEIDRAQKNLAATKSNSAATPRAIENVRIGLAAAYARARDPAGVRNTLAGMAQIRTSTGFDPSDSWGEVERQYLKAGELDEAAAMARGGDPAGTGYIFVHAARAFAKAGRFDEAHALVAGESSKWKLEGLYDIAAAQSKSGKLDGLSKCIDNVPSPADRVILNLCVANAISGRTNHWLDQGVVDGKFP